MNALLPTSLWLLLIVFASACVATGSQSLVKQQGVSNSSIVGASEQGQPSFERWRSCARLVHPNDGDSAAALQEMFQRPESIEQLLRNLKLAWDREWLLQPLFFDDATLQKFFNASTVKTKTPSTFFGLEYVSANVAAHVERDAFPQMTVRIESSCTLGITLDAYGHPSRDAVFTGLVDLDVGSTPEMTLRLVREVFGHEDTNNPERGMDQHGTPYTPTIKGNVMYFNQPRTHQEGAVIDVAFYFKLDTPGKYEPLREIVDDDVVQEIIMNDSRHRSFETP